jgi:hypothetical protein
MSASDGDRKLKAATSALLKLSGAVTFAEVTVRTQSRRSHRESVAATDLDVLGVRVASDLSTVRIAAECKSGSCDIASELYKLAGVIASERVDRGMFVNQNRPSRP